MAKQPLRKKLSKRDSYIFLNPQIPRILQAIGSSHAVGSTGSPSRTSIKTSPRGNEYVASYQHDQRFESGRKDTEFLLNDTKEEDAQVIGKFEKLANVLEDLKKELETDDHKIPLDDIFLRYATNSVTGLTNEQVTENMQTHGANLLTSPKENPEWMKLVEHLMSGFAILLWIGVVLCFSAFIVQRSYMENTPCDNLYLGIVLAAVALFSGIFAYYQEAKSSNIMDSFKKMVPQLTLVLREGTWNEIDVTELVVGDIVQINSGGKIPADVRLTECDGLKVDNSSLTGESEPQKRSIHCTHDNPLETQNLCFFSTSAIEGQGKGVVINVGDRTLMGRIAGLACRLESKDTPMSREMAHFVKVISLVAIFFGALFFGISVSLGNSWLDSSVFLIGIIVANVPEGLLATVTVCLALTAKRMAHKNCLVKHLEAVETLGSTNCICSDKTGTLAQNKMTVSHLWYNNVIHDCNTAEDIFLRWLAGRHIDIKDPGFLALSTVGALCSRPKFKPAQFAVPIAHREVIGDASEGAILKCMQVFLGNMEMFRRKYPKVCEIPFKSRNKYQLSIHELKNDDENNCILVMKGARENILECCSTIFIDGEELELTEEWKHAFELAYSTVGEMGERVLGFCDYKISKTAFPLGHKFDVENLGFLEQKCFRFVGLMSLIDPPRSSVPDSVAKCRSAGIKIIMVTGDHPLTGKSWIEEVKDANDGGGDEGKANGIYRMEDLPVEMFMKILSYLTEQELVQSRLVNSQWNEISCLLLQEKTKNNLDSKLIVQLKNNMVCETVISKSLDEFLQCFSPSEAEKSSDLQRPFPFSQFSFEELRYMNITKMCDFVFTFGPHMKTVVVDIDDKEDVPCFEKFWRLLLHVVPEIQCLRIVGVDFLADVCLIDPVIKFLSKTDPEVLNLKETFLKNLKTLIFTNSEESDHCNVFLKDLLHNTPKIHAVEFRDNNWRSPYCDLKSLEILQRISKVDLLKEMYVSGSRNALAPVVLMKNLQLMKLEAYVFMPDDPQTTDEGSAEYIFLAMKSSQETLSNLDLSNVTTEGMNHCFRDISSLPNVHKLCLDFEIEDGQETGIILQRFSHICPNTTDLDLRTLKCDFSSIAPTLWTGFKGLKSLTLKFVVGDNVNNPLALDVDFSGYSDESIERIQSKLQEGISLEEARRGETQKASILDLKGLSRLELQFFLGETSPEREIRENQLRNLVFIKILPQHIRENPRSILYKRTTPV